MRTRSDELRASGRFPLASATGSPLRSYRAAGRRTGWALGLLTAALVGLAAVPDRDLGEQRLLNGAAIGTSFGVVGTAITGGCIPCGAVVGLAVGAGLGHLYDTRQHTHGPSVLAWRLPDRPRHF